MRKLLAPEVEDHGWQRSAGMPPDPSAHGGEHSCRCAQLGASAGAGGAAKGVRAPAERPQNMPITPHESIAGHRFSYNRHERHCGGVVAQDLSDRPPQVQLARSWPAHAVPRSSPLFAPCPRSTWVNLANGSPGREAQRGGAPGPACAQESQVRCGCARCRQARPAAVVRACTHTSTHAQRCLRSAHTQLA